MELNNIQTSEVCNAIDKILASSNIFGNSKKNENKENENKENENKENENKEIDSLVNENESKSEIDVNDIDIKIVENIETQTNIIKKINTQTQTEYLENMEIKQMKKQMKNMKKIMKNMQKQMQQYKYFNNYLLEIDNRLTECELVYHNKLEIQEIENMRINSYFKDEAEEVHFPEINL